MFGGTASLLNLTNMRKKSRPGMRPRRGLRRSRTCRRVLSLHLSLPDEKLPRIPPRRGQHALRLRQGGGGSPGRDHGGGRPVGAARRRRASAYRVINAGYWKRFEQGRDRPGRRSRSGRFADLLSAARASTGMPPRRGGLLPRAPVAEGVLPARTRARWSGSLARGAAARAWSRTGFPRVQRGRLARVGHRGPVSPRSSSPRSWASRSPTRGSSSAACEALGLAAADLLCVGDNPVADIGGALAAGIDACWYAPAGAAWPGPARAAEMRHRRPSESCTFRHPCEGARSVPGD